MKKILFIILTLLLVCSYNEEQISADTSSKYHIVNDVDTKEEYNLVLNPGYYIFINENVEFESKMILGDAVIYITYEDIAFARSDLFIELAVPPNDNELVNSFLDNYYSELEITEESTNWNINIMMVKVNSYAVFDPNSTETMRHLEVFHASSKPVNSNTTISGSKTHLISVESPLSLDEIKDRYSATDEVDGDITNRLEFQTDYNPEIPTPRSYYILVSVTDSAGNTTYAADIILVKDITKPTTTLTETEITIEVGTVYTIEDIKPKFIFNDNYSNEQNLKTYINDYYHDSYDKVGEYTVVGRCMDEAGNNSEYATYTIKVVDTQNPDIFLLDGSNRLEADHVLSDDEIKQYFKIVDNYYEIECSEIEIITNTCTGVQGKDYEIVVKVTDGSNNPCEKKFIYHLLDIEKPVINVSNTIYIEAGTKLTNEQFIELLKDIGAVPSDASNVTIDEQIDDDGKTTVSYTTTFADGSTKKETIIIEYYNKKTEDKNDSLLIITLAITSILMIGCGLIGFKKKN